MGNDNFSWSWSQNPSSRVKDLVSRVQCTLIKFIYFKNSGLPASSSIKLHPMKSHHLIQTLNIHYVLTSKKFHKHRLNPEKSFLHLHVWLMWFWLEVSRVCFSFCAASICWFLFVYNIISTTFWTQNRHLYKWEGKSLCSYYYVIAPKNTVYEFCELWILSPVNTRFVILVFSLGNFRIAQIRLLYE